MTINMKKLFLVLVLCLCSLATWAYDFSAVAPSGQTLYYRKLPGLATCVVCPSSSSWEGYTQPTGNLIIPSSVTTGSVTLFVTAIDNAAFRGCDGLTSVSIPSSVTSIGYNAFMSCYSLDTLTVDANNPTYDSRNNCNAIIEKSTNKLIIGTNNSTIPNTVTAIGKEAFFNCYRLDSVIIPDAVTTIETNAFGHCTGLSSLIIGNSVTSIQSAAFADCYSLISVTIPELVTTIEPNTFINCSRLTRLTIGKSVTTIRNYAFYGCNNVTTLYYNAKNLTTTSNWHNSSESNNIYGFRSMPLRTLLIGDSVETLPEGVFYGQNNVDTLYYNAKNLTTTADWYNASSDYNNYGFRMMPLQTLVIGDSVKMLPAGVFYGLDDLTSVTIGESVTTIENQAFEGCTNVTTLNYNAKNLTTTSDWYNIYADYNTYGFRPMPLQTLVIGDSVGTLPQGVFYKQASITSLTIPTTVTSIGEYAFNGCRGLTGSLTIPESVTAIGNNAFEGCGGLTGSLTIPHSVTTIGDHTFAGCSGFTDVTIPNSVTTIENHAFVSCDFASAVIGSKVATIGQDAFGGCPNLKTVYNLSNLPITKGATDNGYVAWKALRVLSATNGGFTNHGAGKNTLHQISTDYTVVDAEDNNVTSIPRSTIPANFIYYYNGAKDGSGWKANEIVLTDDTSRFVAPEEFTAEKATYTREFTNSNRSTLYLPFTAAVPEGFEVYDFAGFDGHTLTFSNHEGNIAAYTPYLVGYDLSKEVNTTQCTITQENVAFPASSSAAAPTPINGMTFQGTTVRTCMTDNNYGYRDGFFVQSARVSNNHNTHAHVNPFRAYFTYSPSSDAPQSLPPTLNVEVSYGDPVGIDAVETPEQEYDGRYGNDVYDMLGRLVRKNATNLEGLPKGIYIWKGKKVVR